MTQCSKESGLEGPFESKGIIPEFDHCVYEVAIEMLIYSTKPGRHSKEHIQFETILQLRTCYGNFDRISELIIRRGLTMSNITG